MSMLIVAEQFIKGISLFIAGKAYLHYNPKAVSVIVRPDSSQKEIPQFPGQGKTEIFTFVPTLMLATRGGAG